jgi:glutaredoxin
MAHKVFVYALSTCPYCRMTKKYLDEMEVAYDFVDVDQLEGDERSTTVAKVKELSGGTSFPVVLVDEDVIVGFNKNRIRELLSL